MTTTERYERGWEKLRQIDGEAGPNVVESLKDIAPDLGKYVVEFAFGDVYSREGLDLRQRELVSISTLVTQGGCEPQLQVHIHAGLNVGLSPQEIVEAITHCLPYVGFPRVLNAMFTAKQVFQERKVTV
ncbi:carboxymuconolactone decarboxylase family protein [Paenibacillus rigui]|uniref:Carboxymuconolactone decarboxylase n=1 Tax=Paenibacillus rigui TaxID=554312 RepID=A0A229UY07_9BACL|nr:carboxymuconolactone decarboxylase family protein [Paenibacillus rigui]OXM88366.1 carboxymuconolactone decarboxylase [Paenibacillus rigui]